MWGHVLKTYGTSLYLQTTAHHSFVRKSCTRPLLGFIWIPVLPKLSIRARKCLPLQMLSRRLLESYLPRPRYPTDPRHVMVILRRRRGLHRVDSSFLKSQRKALAPRDRIARLVRHPRPRATVDPNGGPTPKFQPRPQPRTAHFPTVSCPQSFQILFATFLAHPRRLV